MGTDRTRVVLTPNKFYPSLRHLFCKEDAFEYGNPLNAWIPSNEAESALSFAAYRWRRKLLKRCKSDESVGSFAGWNVSVVHYTFDCCGVLEIVNLQCCSKYG